MMRLFVSYSPRSVRVMGPAIAVKGSGQIYHMTYSRFSIFVSRFLAGMANKNMSLLAASAQIFDESTKSKIPKECIPKFLPKTKGDINKVIDAYKVLDQQRLLSFEF